ncbi:hypothetical protein [Phreatobacter sp. AB_2022a]|uniref:hypothetical protein n=1 Tax=Phreatobacter sp. AB_2022a TaxID=3003134 RepID=UPI003FA6D537
MEQKKALGHGDFLPWIEAEFEMHRDSAHRYMTIAEEMGSNVEHVRHLSPRAPYALAAPSTPESVRENCLRRRLPIVVGPDACGSQQVRASGLFQNLYWYPGPHHFARLGVFTKTKEGLAVGLDGFIDCVRVDHKCDPVNCSLSPSIRLIRVIILYIPQHSIRVMTLMSLMEGDRGFRLFGQE